MWHLKYKTELKKHPDSQKKGKVKNLTAKIESLKDFNYDDDNIYKLIEPLNDEDKITPVNIRNTLFHYDDISDISSEQLLITFQRVVDVISGHRDIADLVRIKENDRFRMRKIF